MKSAWEKVARSLDFAEEGDDDHDDHHFLLFVYTD